MERTEFLKQVKRIVVKVGTSILTTDTGRIDNDKITNLVGQLVTLRKKDFDVLLVSSGAIAAGLEALNFNSMPKAIPELQASAAVGQGLLAHKYADLFKKEGINVGQVLVTRHDTTHRQQYVNAKNTLNKLLDLHVLPIINENDSTAVDEIKFGDNDTLAALVANIVEADLLIILSDVDGLHSSDPKSSEAELIPKVEIISREIESVAGMSGTTFGKGGMETKIQAAKMATAGQTGVVIANGHKADILLDILQGEIAGTFFVPKKEKIAARKLWILNQPAKGTIYVDEGAGKAIREEGRSLLAAGVISADGNFEIEDAVKIKVQGDTQHRSIRGIVNYNSDQLRRIAGKNYKQIKKILDIDSVDEVVHRDQMVMMKEKIKKK